MTRPTIAAMALCLALGGISSHAAGQPARVPRIGVLAGPSAAGNEAYVEAGRDALRQLGWVEGRNIQIDWRWGDSTPARVQALAEELVSQKPDVIVTIAEGPTGRVMRGTTAIPIVMVAVDDPVTLGFVASLARPGANVTGIASFLPELAAKRVQLLRELAPRVSRVGFIWNGNPGGALGLRETQAAARRLGLTVQPFEVKRDEDIPRAFAAIASERMEALIVLTDPRTWNGRAQVVELANRQRLPAMYELREFADAGGLVSYGASLVEMIRRAAVYIDKILKGARPGDLPVEQPSTFELVVNVKTARQIGLSVPRSVLLRADALIE
ncbi:MAG: ABC transporter substrate-binding protein [Candidatus Rokubacteria bacterium]|nr:ABC transporter substrate-binding protein [Candidatus Rokubacteria bacterium]MBI3827244.1 ABC transporter substrate-binding protein [Candidatus Rokubacteria bacterium]